MNSFNVLVLRTDSSFVTKKVLFNSFSSLNISEGDKLISLFKDISYQTFFEIVSNESSQKANQLFAINDSQIDLYKFVDDDDFVLILVEVEYTQEAIMDELMKINNKQINYIRDLKKQLQFYSNYDELIEETMRLNNELVNVRRDLSIQNKRLEKGNITDPMTRINNRRKFFQDIYEFVKDGNYLLYLLDINNFKSINDDLGHAKGDEALILLSKLLSGHAKSIGGDAYRLGGDEFAILVPQDSSFDMKDVTIVLDEMLQDIHPLTGVSYGEALVTKDNCNTVNKAEERMSIADSNMYEMKRKIKNEQESK